MISISKEEGMGKTSKSKTRRVSAKKPTGKGETIVELLRRKGGATLAVLGN